MTKQNRILEAAKKLRYLVQMEGREIPDVSWKVCLMFNVSYDELMQEYDDMANEIVPKSV